MSTERTLQEISRGELTARTASAERIQLGALLRIADAMEAIQEDTARSLSVMKELRSIAKTCSYSCT